MVLLDQSFRCDNVAPSQMDELWSFGWRHFGEYFFRYSLATHNGHVCRVIPLRIDLNKFSPSRSQKRVLSKNRDVKIIVRDTLLDELKADLFYRHRNRFSNNIPDSIYDFLAVDAATVPCMNREICVYSGERLIATSFLDIGFASTSAVYAMFDPVESKRSLGILTMLEAIRYTRELNCSYYYPGYAYVGSSSYEYKKNFSGLEFLDWEKGWRHYTKEEELNYIDDYFDAEVTSI